MRNAGALVCGGAVGILGGLIGLGGAEFRLPLLVGIFRYRVLQAIIINLIVSLATVIFSFLFRARHVPLEQVAAQWHIIGNILAGTLLGSFAGVRFATQVKEKWLHRFAALLLIALSFVLMSHHRLFGAEPLAPPGAAQFAAAFAAGLVIGVVSSMLGVAGGELIIPTVVLLFGADIKLAGSLSLAISVPTILMGLWRYHRRQSLTEQRPEAAFMGWMAAGSIAGAFAGSRLLPFVSGVDLHLILGCVLLVSAAKMLLQRANHG